MVDGKNILVEITIETGVAATYFQTTNLHTCGGERCRVDAAASAGAGAGAPTSDCLRAAGTNTTRREHRTERIASVCVVFIIHVSQSGAVCSSDADLLLVQLFIICDSFCRTPLGQSTP